MKKTLISLVILIALFALGFSAYKAYQREMVLQDQRQDVAWEKSDKRNRVMSEKIDILDGLAIKLENHVGNIADLHLIDPRCLPDVVKYRWEKYLEGSHEDQWETMNFTVEITIWQLLYVYELLKEDKVTENYPKFCYIARDKKTGERDLARREADDQSKTLLYPLRAREKEIENLAWKDIPQESKLGFKNKREWLKRSH